MSQLRSARRNVPDMRGIGKQTRLGSDCVCWRYARLFEIDKEGGEGSEAVV